MKDNNYNDKGYPVLSVRVFNNENGEKDLETQN